MKTSYLLGTLVVALILQTTHAFETLQLQNVKLNLESQSGAGGLVADNLKLNMGPLRVESPTPQLTFSWLGGTFKTELENIQLAYAFGPESVLAGLKGVETENLTLDYQENRRLSLENHGLLIEHSDTRQYIPALSLTCAAQAQKSLVEDLSSQCLHLGRLQIPELNFDELSGSKVAASFEAPQAIDKIEEIDLMILQKGFNLTFRIKYLFRWKIKASGSVDYSEENSRITIHLAKAKVGFLSLKSRLLKEIAEANLESIKVEGDNIIIQI